MGSSKQRYSLEFALQVHGMLVPATRHVHDMSQMSTPIAEIFGRPSMAVRASMPAIADDSAAGSSTSAQEPAKPALAESSSEPAGLPHSMSAISFQDTEIHASRELSPRGSGSMVRQALSYDSSCSLRLQFCQGRLHEVCINIGQHLQTQKLVGNAAWCNQAVRTRMWAELSHARSMHLHQ